VKYSDLYRVEATRLKSWDYSTPGWYFITIVCKEFVYYFDNDVVKAIAEEYWKEIPKHFPNVKLGEYVVMPNHIHGVIEIPEVLIKPGVNINPLVETHHDASLPQNGLFQWDKPLTIKWETAAVKHEFYQAIGRKSGQTIPESIKKFKGAVTTQCQNQNLPFKWQPRFYDHIVRNEASLTLIENYICDNPKNWDSDRNNILHKRPE